MLRVNKEVDIRGAEVEKTREALQLGVDSVECRQAEEKRSTRKLIDVGSIHPEQGQRRGSNKY